MPQTTIIHVDDDAFGHLVSDYVRSNPDAVTVESVTVESEVFSDLPVEEPVVLVLDGPLRPDAAEERETAESDPAGDQIQEFAANVSHDVRGPLSVADGYVELARETGDLGYLDDSVRALDRIATLLDHLEQLVVEGREVADTEPVDLRAVVEAAWETAATGDARLEVEGSRTVLADGTRLQQLLENLFRNAGEHAGPVVTVRVGPLDDEGFYVEDDGSGIPEAEREAVFEPGYSGDDGTGLGLGICRCIAAAHGWEMVLTESADGGVRFELSGVTMG